MKLRETLLTASFAYDDKAINCPIELSPDSTTVNNIVMLGSMQVGKTAAWVASDCPPNTAVAPGAEHWHARPDGSDIPDIMSSYTKYVLDYTLAATGHAASVIAESQAAAALINVLAIGDWSDIKDVVLLQPLGLNPQIFSKSNSENIKEFQRRIARNGKHQLRHLATDRRLVYNHHLLSKTLLATRKTAAAHYASGLGTDIVNQLATVSQSHRVVIICGGKDEIFPAGEIRDHLGKAGLAVPVRVAPGVPHSPPATKLGFRLVKLAFEELAAASNWQSDGSIFYSSTKAR